MLFRIIRLRRIEISQEDAIGEGGSIFEIFLFENKGIKFKDFFTSYKSKILSKNLVKILIKIK